MSSYTPPSSSSSVYNPSYYFNTDANLTESLADARYVKLQGVSTIAGSLNISGNLNCYGTTAITGNISLSNVAVGNLTVTGALVNPAITALQNSNSTINTNLTNLQNANSTTNTNLTNLQNANSTTNTNLTNLQSGNATANIRISSVEQKTANITQSNGLTFINNELQSLGEFTASSNITMSSTTTGSFLQTKHIIAKTGNINANSSVYLVGNLFSRTLGNADVFNTIQNLQLGNATLSTQIQALQTSNTTLSTQVQALQTSNTTLSTQIQALQTSNTALNNTVSGFSSNINTVLTRTQLLSSNTTISTLNGTLVINRDSTISGSVGIGTTSASANLHIENNKIFKDSNKNTLLNPNQAHIYCVNSNTSDSEAHAIMCLRTGGSTSGNPALSFDVAGVWGWSLFCDNSDSRALKIKNAWDMPTSSTYDCLRIGTDRSFTVYGNPSIRCRFFVSAATGSVSYTVGNNVGYTSSNWQDISGTASISNGIVTLPSSYAGFYLITFSGRVTDTSSVQGCYFIAGASSLVGSSDNIFFIPGDPNSRRMYSYSRLVYLSGGTQIRSQYYASTTIDIARMEIAYLGVV